MSSKTSDINIFKQLNLSDKLLFLFIVLEIFGIMGDALQSVRLYGLVLVPVTITYFIKNKGDIYVFRLEIFTFLLWISYGVISLLWTPDPGQSIKDIVYLFVNFFIFLSMISLSRKANHPEKIISAAWFILFLLTIPIALNELINDVHLPMAVQDEGLVLKYANITFERKFASVTFGNLNGYNTMLMYILPFSLYLLSFIQNRFMKILLWSTMLLLIYIIIMNGSRGAFLCMFIVFSTYLFLGADRKRRWIILTVVSIVVVYASITYFDEIFGLIMGRFEEQGFSDDGRSQIIRYSLESLLRTGLIGTGAGSFITTMALKYNLDNPAPHNLFLEVLMQYGIVIFVLFVFFFVKLYLFQRRTIDPLARFVILSSLLMTPILTTIDSSYLLGTGIWVFLASLYIIGLKSTQTET